MPYLVPQYGFSSAAWDPPKWSTDQELVGSVETVSATFTPAALRAPATLARKISGSGGAYGFLSGDGELLIYNRGDKECGFAICLSVGIPIVKLSTEKGVWSCQATLGATLP